MDMNFDWREIMIGDLDFSFAIEIILRTVIMFSTLLLVLRLSGKKGVRQLSLFEVAIIIGLGSAAGDPMFNKDIAILPALIVFAAILGLYRLITYVASINESFEKVLEGEPMYIVEDGEFVLMKESEHTFAKDEILSEMRQESIEHVGQVKTAILESTGKVSFYFYDDGEVKLGLPILPKVFCLKCEEIESDGKYACCYCGRVQTLTPGKHQCSRCNKKEWVAAIQTVRIT